MKKTVGARELKMRLGAYFREVSRGATLVVTERGEPVAELRPIRRGGRREEARLEELVTLGILSRKSRKPLAPFEPVRATRRSLVAHEKAPFLRRSVIASWRRFPRTSLRCTW